MLRNEKLAMCRYMILMLRFRYFQVFLFPGFYNIAFFFRCFYFYFDFEKFDDVIHGSGLLKETLDSISVV